MYIYIYTEERTRTHPARLFASLWSSSAQCIIYITHTYTQHPRGGVSLGFLETGNVQHSVSDDDDDDDEAFFANREIPH